MKALHLSSGKYTSLALNMLVSAVERCVSLRIPWALPKIWGIVCACCFDRRSVIYSWKRDKESVLSFQEDDGDGKVPVSALTRWDGPWPGGDKRSEAHGGSDLHPALRT